MVARLIAVAGIHTEFPIVRIIYTDFSLLLWINGCPRLLTALTLRYLFILIRRCVLQSKSLLRISVLFSMINDILLIL